ncbi:hepatocyte cell adhesion molecule [Fundulus heteroclitus]|uniref:hepatocyte cell adhesion molecule n=1 Tax=Fundulus heteroclitus TaxID=8078 RepID=UPI00165B6861|nr:hepatocyte cell adhesion molecule [Fundulus heteroclitus]
MFQAAMAAQLGVSWLSVYFTAVLLCCVCANKERNVFKARERTTITLQTGESQPHTQVVWTFGAENPNIRIATIKMSEVKSDYEENFRDRLLLDLQTGALTITQVKTSDSGKYRFNSIGGKIITKDFHLIVYSLVPAPSLSTTSAVITTSSSSVTVECSVHNSRELTLSWYRGKERLKKTSSPKLSSKLTLSLEVNATDRDNHSCVAENPVEKKTTKLPGKDINLENTENGSWCQNEVPIRLIISAGLALVLILLLVDHVRLCQ